MLCVVLCHEAKDVWNTCSCTSDHMSILQPSCHTDMTITLSVVPLGETAMFFNVCTLSVYSICILLQMLQEDACVFVWGADGQCTLTAVVICITCEGVTWTCHRAWEPKKSYVSPHPGPAAADLPLVWVVGICFVYGPAAAWRSFSLRTLEGRVAAANLTRAGSQGRSQPVVATSGVPSCCLTAQQWEVRDGCVLGCDVLFVCAHMQAASNFMHAMWLIGLSH